MIDRRKFLAAGGAGMALAALGVLPEAFAAKRIRLGNAQKFSHEALIQEAQQLAAKPYAPPIAPPRDLLDKIDYEAHGKIKFSTDAAVFADGPGKYPVTFFAMGRYFQTPVHMFVVDQGASRELLYDPSSFDMPADSPARKLSKGAGFAGFRIQESRSGGPKLDWKKNDWVAFLGASYFRAIGELYQYGLSARGVAVNVSAPGSQEEFPAFTHFYFETPSASDDAMVVHALLDGPSLAGAYRFHMTRGKSVNMEVDAALFLRKDIAQLGLAPMTSMYWFSETIKETATDWRPEVHDSDGLAMWNGKGEHIWRPLNNPKKIMTSTFIDENPRGFGLLQRDRNFDHYLDGVNYDKRPSLWVEPLDEWGAGSVQLIELPTNDEIQDNIVAMWVPRDAARAGANYRLRYKLHWAADEPYPTPLARCVATRIGRGGQPGQARPPALQKFMVEFLGGPLDKLPFGIKPEPVLSSSRGEFSYVFTEAVPDGVTGHWRAQFDLKIDGKEPAELRLYLKSAGKTLSETWLYQFHPPA